MTPESLARQVDDLIAYLGQWPRYMDELNLTPFMEKEWLRGLPPERRLKAAARLLEDAVEQLGCWREYVAMLCQGLQIEDTRPIDTVELLWAALRKTPEDRARASVALLRDRLPHASCW